MAKRNPQEIDFKRTLRKWWDPYWSESYEPGTGSGTGYPDIQLLDPRRLLLLPVELKVGELLGDMIIPREVRPAQCVWHHKFHEAGGRATIAVGVKIQDTWEAFFFPGHYARSWKLGWRVEEGKRVVLHKMYDPNVNLLRVVTHFLLA